MRCSPMMPVLLMMAAPVAAAPSEVERCQQSLPKVKTMTGGELKWTLSFSSPLLPGIRIFRATDRYPRAVIMDCRHGKKLESVGAAELSEALKAHHAKCPDARRAEQATELFLRLRYQPYEAQEIKLSGSHKGGKQLVVADYSRTEPWSPPARPMEVRSRTSKSRAKVQVDSHCQITLVEDKVLETTPH